nr:glycosyl hydrolase [Microvirga puerhi]
MARERDLLITLEPWSWSPEKRIPRRALADGIINGRFDENIQRVCRTVGQLRSHVTIRWAHEMDDTSGRYTWSLWEPRDYIRAYRHFVETCRREAASARFMWALKGENLLNAFYPGDEYVDVIGLSIFGLQDYDIDKFGRNRSFEEITRISYDRVTSYKKPIYIAELGIHGDDEYTLAWWNGVRNASVKFPALQAIIYFNEVETYPWPEHYGRPDWRVRRDIGADETQ